MLRIKLLEAAQAEAAAAIAWYEKREIGLGKALREAIEKAFSSIQKNPLAYPVVEKSEVRRILTERFPYVIIYIVERDRLLIISAFHTSRNPTIWRDRIG